MLKRSFALPSITRTMKLYIFSCLLLWTGSRVEGKGCQVAAMCDYGGGNMKAEFRHLPTQNEVNKWDRGGGPDVPVPPVENQCGEPGWLNGMGGYQYKILNARADWDTSIKICRSLGATLPSNGIKDKESLTFLTDRLRHHGSIDGYWIGLTDEGSEGVWHWVDGSTLTDNSNWGGGQPDNWQQNQNCARISRDHNYAWDDAECSVMFQVLCERMCQCA